MFPGRQQEDRAARAALAGEASADAALAGAAAAEVEAAPTVPPDLTAAAFFDVDNTMMMGASIFHFARGLAARKFINTGDLTTFVWQQLRFRVGGRELGPDQIHATRQQALSFVTGRPIEELVELGEDITTSSWRTGSGQVPARSPRCISMPASGCGW